MKASDTIRFIRRKAGLTKGDLLLTGLLLAAAGLTALFFLPQAAPKKFAVVTADGREVCRLPLDQDGSFRIGSGNTLTIRGGTAYMSEADCPDRICVTTGGISRTGQTIVCAPHRIVVTITGGGGDESPTDLFVP